MNEGSPLAICSIIKKGPDGIWVMAALLLWMDVAHNDVAASIPVRVDTDPRNQTNMRLVCHNDNEYDSRARRITQCLYPG